MKKRNMTGLICGLLALLLVLAMSTTTVSGVTCQEALITLRPCQSFLVGSIPSPSGPCCVATQRVSDKASTKEIRQMLCKCFKKAAAATGIKPEFAKKLPDLCKVQTPVPVDPDVDCNTVG